ncbi:hypothetical protein [Kordia sp.]|uniref:hypothetical protein n=1 Tax=Kordia sp. TaxID=1965332 RepID=UPI003D2724C5
MRITIILFLLIGINFSNAQTDFNKEIIGTWKLSTQTKSFKATDKPKSSSNSVDHAADALINSDVLLSFKKDDVLVMTLQDFLLEASYTLKNNLLTIGLRKFEILKLQNDVLTLKDKLTEKNLRYEYKRILNNE